MRTKAVGVFAVIFLAPLFLSGCAYPDHCWLGGYNNEPCTIIGVMEEKSKAAANKAARIEREQAEERAWAQKSADPDFQARLEEQLRLQNEACSNRKSTGGAWTYSC